MDLFNPAAIVPYFQFKRTLFSAGLAAGTKIAPYNSSRVVLMISPSGGSVIASPVAFAAAGDGISFNDTSNGSILTWQNHSILCVLDWYLTASPASNFTVTEISFYPPIGGA